MPLGGDRRDPGKPARPEAKRMRLTARERLQLAHEAGVPEADSPVPEPDVLETVDEADESVAESRERLSRLHMFSAHHFAESAQALENKGARKISPAERRQHRAHVIASVLTAAAFLETSINELYMELQNPGPTGQSRLPPRGLALLARVWPEVVGSPVLHRYQVALSVADGDNFAESRPPFVDADNLVRIRNALFSCTPEWDDSRGRHQTLEKRLKTKFPPSALALPDAPWFPELCLGAGCAQWAVKTAQVFSDDFCHRMGIPVRARVGGP